MATWVHARTDATTRKQKQMQRQETTVAEYHHNTYTPTADEMREAWVYMQWVETIAGKEIAEVQADNFFAAHDRQVAAKALEEAAYEWGEGTWQDVWAGDGVDDDVTAVQSTVRWLRARAAVYRSTVKGEGN